LRKCRQQQQIKKENNEVGCIASVTTRLKRRRRKGEKPRSLLQRQVILRKKPNDCANAREKAKKRGKSTSDNGKCSRRKLKQKVETNTTQLKKLCLIKKYKNTALIIKNTSIQYV